MKHKQYENIARKLLFFGAAFMLISTPFFFLNRHYCANEPIASEVFGQYGDLIGGFVGTLVAAVSVVLLYETLNEQRNQFLKQQQNAEAALNEQRSQFQKQRMAENRTFREQQLQFQKQSDDQVFYRILDTQQNRIINTTIQNPPAPVNYSGYAIFSLLSTLIRNNIKTKLALLVRRLICENPLLVDDDLLLDKLFVAREPGYVSSQYQHKRDEFRQLIRMVRDQRWEFLKVYLGPIGNESPTVQKALEEIGGNLFYKVDFEYRKVIYRNVFESLLRTHGFFLDRYLQELEFLCQFIESSSNRGSHLSYFGSQLTKYEYVIIFYYLLSKHASENFLDFFDRNIGLQDKFASCASLLIDTPSDENIQEEIVNLLNLYVTG